MDKLEDFFNHEETVVSTAAWFIADIKEQYEAGNITDAEFKELTADALEIKDVFGLADDLDRKVAISRALAALGTIASFIPVWS